MRLTRARTALLGAVLVTASGSAMPGGPQPHARSVMAKPGSAPATEGTQATLAIQTAVSLRGVVSPAQPFYLDAAWNDRARALDCLAAADFYEAGRGASDQRAVAQVVLNRVRHAAFPATICGVVFEGAERPTGCQFTFTCDGSLDRRRPSPEAWKEARAIAGEMLLGRVEAAVGQATHYHTDWVAPVWDRTMDRLAEVRSHLFFRWRGTKGAASAFTQRYAGAEPRISRLASLSAAHATAETEPSAQALAAGVVPSAPPATTQAAPLPTNPAPEPGVFLVILPAVTASDSFLSLARQRCAGLTECRFIGWTDPTRRARALPLPGRSVDAISFTFVRRAGSTVERAQWNCAEFARDNPGDCLHRGT